MKASHLLLIYLALLLLGVHTVDGWSEHFTTDNSAGWGGDAGSYNWNTALSTGWLNNTGVTSQYYYQDAKFDEGWYNSTLQEATGGSGVEHVVIYGSQAVDSGSPLGGTKYEIMLYNAGQIYFIKELAGAYSEQLLVNTTTNGLHDLNISWTPGVSSLIYWDGSLIGTVNDVDITDPGYYGIGHLGPALYFAIDSMQFDNGTVPVTPTPTPTPAPTPGVRAANTSPWVYSALPNQHGMDDLPLFNLTYLGPDLAIGNIVYPPIYESNSDIIPWEIWAVFLVMGVLGIFGAFVYPLPEGQVIASVYGMMFSGYAFILSSMIGFASIATNVQMWQVTVGQTVYWVMPMVIQPVYTVYNPPWLWVIMIALVFMAIAGLGNAIYNLVMKIREPGRKGVRR